MWSVHMPCYRAHGRRRTFKYDCWTEILEWRLISSNYSDFDWCDLLLSFVRNSSSGYQIRKSFNQIKRTRNLFNKNRRFWFGYITSWRVACWHILWNSRLCGSWNFKRETLRKGMWLLEHRSSCLHNPFRHSSILFCWYKQNLLLNNKLWIQLRR